MSTQIPPFNPSSSNTLPYQIGNGSGNTALHPQDVRIDMPNQTDQGSDQGQNDRQGSDQDKQGPYQNSVIKKPRKDKKEKDASGRFKKYRHKKGLPRKKDEETVAQYRMRRIFMGRNMDEAEEEDKHHRFRAAVKREIRRHVSEFVGTFYLILFICGIQVSSGISRRSPVMNIDKGLTSGFILSGLIYAFGKVSGAHFNPCVTFAFFLRGCFNIYRTITYITAQFAGAIVGAAVLYGLFGTEEEIGTTVPAQDVSASHAFGLEILLSFIFYTVIMATAENSKILGPTSALGVGTTFVAVELFGWNLTGASVNPWRTIAPMLISGYGWKFYWIYIVGPFIGAIGAVLLQRLFVSGYDHELRPEVGKGEGKNPNIEDE